MAGLVTSIVPVRSYDFTWLSANSSHDLVIKRAIDIRLWRQVSLIVRVSACEIDTGAAIAFTVQSEGLTDDDPGQEFLTAPNTIATIDSQLTPPASLIKAVADRLTPLGPAIRLSLHASRGASMASKIAAMLSIDLCLKNGIE